MTGRHEIFRFPRRTAVFPTAPTATPAPLSHDATKSQRDAHRAAGAAIKYHIQEAGLSGEVDVSLLEGSKLVAVESEGAAPTSVQVQGSVISGSWVDVGSTITSFPAVLEIDQPYRALRINVVGFASPDDANYVDVRVAGFNSQFDV